MADRFDVRADELLPFARALRRMPRAWEDVRKAWQSDGTASIAEDAQQRAASLGSVAAKAGSDIRALARGQIKYGGQGYSMGAEFGSKRYQQFMDWRGNDENAGYFMFPALRAFNDQAAEKWLEHAEESLSKAFPD